MAAFRSTVLACSRGWFLKKCQPRSSKLLLVSNGLAWKDTCTNHLLLGQRRFLTNSSLYNIRSCRSWTARDDVYLVRKQDLVELPFSSQVQRFSTQKKSTDGGDSEITKEAKTESTEENLSVFQRFKQTYKEHGKILIAVHCVTSAVWFGSFYMIAASGLDIVPWMEGLGFSETLIKPFRSGGLGFVAVAYLLYKLATPARYTVTLGGTNMTIRYFRRVGRMDRIPQSERFRELYKDGKSELKERHFAFHQRRAKTRKQRVVRNNSQ